MSDIKWTKEQQQAIDTHGCNLLVAAAAGSGKTAVLVERIIKMITDKENPIDIDRLLVVTFTKAAAAEMRERIAEALSKEIHKSINPSASIQRQLTLLNKASITTIHSFCLEVIKNNFHLIDLDPGFRIADDTEAVLLKQEAVDELFEDKYSQIEDANNNESEFNKRNYCTREEFFTLVESYCSKRDDFALKEMILSLYNFSMSTPYPEKWLKEKVELLNIEGDDFQNSEWAEILKADIHNELIELKGIMFKAIDIINKSSDLEPYYEMFENEYSLISNAVTLCEDSWESMLTSVKNIKFGRLKSIRNCSDIDGKEKVQEIRKKVKEKVEEIKKITSMASDEDTMDDIRFMYNIINSLTKLTIEFGEKFKIKKKERGIIDFNDFEHFCLDILIKKDEEGKEIIDNKGRYVPSEAAERLRNKYEEILIDEYQDSNMVQEVILNLISKERQGCPNVFMVGDVKQSIYRFRQAKPELFLNKYNTYSDINGEKYRKIALFKNFRSRKEVVDAVNFVFEQIMSQRVGELEYDEKEALNLGASFGNENELDETCKRAVELHIIENDDIEDLEEDGEEALSNIELEAAMVAKRIKELVDNKEENAYKVVDKNTKQYRNVHYKDIVILLRSTSKWSPIFVEMLKNNDIPVYADVGTGYFETTEIKTMMALLQIIDNPRQDIPLLAVMRSPIGNFTPEELIDIRVIDRKVSFYETLLKTMDNGQWTIDNGNENLIDDIENMDSEIEDKEIINNKTIEKLSAFVNKLNQWREKSHFMPLDEFIWYLYKQTGYYGFVGAMSAGMQRQANLRILFQRASQYEQTSYKGLFNFINFINKLKKSNGDMGSAKILGENENVVRIMSIHKSKGLEFPIVFVSGMGKRFNLQDLNRKLLLHHELGFGPEYIDVDKRITNSTLPKEAIKKKILIETLSEEMRILYVALTRAKEKLILTGSVKKIDEYCKKHSNDVDNPNKKLSEYNVLRGRTYFDWIIPAVMKHNDGYKLREAAGFDEERFTNVLQDDSKWNIILWNRTDIEEKKTREEKLNKQNNIEEYIEECSKKYSGEDTYSDKEKNVCYKKFIHERLGFEYSYKKSSELPTVITVTELKRRMNSESDIENGGRLYMVPLHKRPQFLEETKGLTAAEKGTAIHNVMQFLQLSDELNYEYIKNEINTMVIKEFLTEEQADSVNINKVVQFFKSNLGNRVLKAYNKEKLYREVPFHIEISSIEVDKELSKDIYKDEKILLQGIIDCYFEENEKLILIDYKTDYVDKHNLQEVVDKYRVQLEYYSRALEEITNKEVKEKYLYLFAINKELLI